MEIRKPRDVRCQLPLIVYPFRVMYRRLSDKTLLDISTRQRDIVQHKFINVRAFEKLCEIRAGSPWLVELKFLVAGASC